MPTIERVQILTFLHDAVKHRCSVNKVGTPIVSDFDKLAADDEEWAVVMARFEAWKLTP